MIYPEAWIGKKVIMGEGCKVQPFAFIPDGVTLEDDVFVGPHACFTNDKYPPSGGKHWLPTLVKKGAMIGAGVIVVPGVVIGEKAFICAGALITKDVPDGMKIKGTW